MLKPLLVVIMVLAAAPLRAEEDRATPPLTHGIGLTGSVGFGMSRSPDDGNPTLPRTRAIGRLDAEVTAQTTLDNGLTLRFRFDLDERVGD